MNGQSEMNEFWLWFWRPIAETLGVLALLVVLGAVYLLFTWYVAKLRKKQ